MVTSSKIIFYSGILVLILSVGNLFTVEELTPSLERAESLSSMSAVGLILISVLWSDISPKEKDIAMLSGKQGFELTKDLDQTIKDELAWGSNLILTATPAATLLIYWNGSTILKRGLMTDNQFVPGPICIQAMNKNKFISLVSTKHFPGAEEFSPILPSLPAIIIQTLSNKGVLIVGGWSERCFSKSDEKWITGWTNKLTEQLT